MDLEKFLKYYPHGTIEEIDLFDAPQIAIQFFEDCNKRFILPEKYRPNNFLSILKISNQSEDLTYAALRHKQHYDNEKNTFNNEYNIFLIDCIIKPIEEKIGHGEIIFHTDTNDPFFTKKPFVGYNYTDKNTNNTINYTRQGFGTRRLVMMNALCQAIWQLPLHSSTLFTTDLNEALESKPTPQPSKRLWQKLTTYEIATQCFEKQKFNGEIEQIKERFAFNY